LTARAKRQQSPPSARPRPRSGTARACRPGRPWPAATAAVRAAPQAGRPRPPRSSHHLRRSQHPLATGPV